MVMFNGELLVYQRVVISQKKEERTRKHGGLRWIGVDYSDPLG